jgi:hypothetical protein
LFKGPMAVASQPGRSDILRRPLLWVGVIIEPADTIACCDCRSQRLSGHITMDWHPATIAIAG